LIPRPAVTIGRTGFAVTTWNPADKNSTVNLTNGDRTATGNGTANYGLVRSTTSKSTGKWHFELTFAALGGSSDSTPAGGLAIGAASLTSNPASSNLIEVAVYISQPGVSRLWFNGSATDGADNLPAGQVVGFDVDLDTEELWYRVGPSGTEQGPFSFSSLTGPYFICGNVRVNASVILNTGHETFLTPVKSGFSAWG
jgi:hypothetical protein